MYIIIYIYMVDHTVRFIHDTMVVPVPFFGSQLKCLALRPGAPTLCREVHGQVLSAFVVGQLLPGALTLFG